MTKAWDIIGYTWEADSWCVDCTIKARNEGRLTCEQYRGPSNVVEPSEDSNGLAYGLADREGNMIRCIFSTDEPPLRENGTSAGLYCGGCGAVIMEPDPEC